MLEVKDLSVKLKENKILNKINLKTKKGEIHFIMGPNGAGKSTLAQVLMGSSNYDISKGSILFNGKRINKLVPYKRAKMGIFLAFQYPAEVEGVKMFSFLRESLFSMSGQLKSQMAVKKDVVLSLNKLGMADNFADRYLNLGFSGGEKKKSEILQALMLKPKLAILDEIDSGLDVDSLKLVVSAIKKLQAKEKTAFLVITHLPRLAALLKPDFVHIMVNGSIVKSGDKKLISIIKKKGYGSFQEE